MDESTERGKQGSERLSDVSRVTQHISRPVGNFDFVSGTLSTTFDAGVKKCIASFQGQMNTHTTGAVCQPLLLVVLPVV